MKVLVEIKITQEGKPPTHIVLDADDAALDLSIPMPPDNRQTVALFATGFPTKVEPPFTGGVEL
jgi:hypothetical protein